MSTTINAHGRTLHIVASQLRQGDRVVQAGTFNYRAEGAIVTEVRQLGSARGNVTVYGTTREHDAEPGLLFRGLHPDLPIIVERDPDLIHHAAGNGSRFTPCGVPLDSITIHPDVNCSACMEALQ